MASFGHPGGRRIIVLAAIGLTGIFLIFANWIVVHGGKNRDEFVIHKTSPVQVPASTRFFIDRIQCSLGTLCEKVEVIGWALPPEEYIVSTGSIFEVSLVFQTGRAWYRVRTMPTPRPDVLAVFKIDDACRIPGFVSVFSPVQMKGGTYRMGVLVQDKGRDLAFSWTTRRFVNDRKGFRELVFQPMLSPFALPEPKGKMRAHAFDVFNVTTTTVDMVGWAFSNTGGLSDEQEVHLVLSSGEHTFSLTTEKQERPDLRAVFGNRMGVIGEDAGYSANLNPSDFPFGTYRFGVLIREKGQDVAFRWMPNRIRHTISNGMVNVPDP